MNKIKCLITKMFIYFSNNIYIRFDDVNNSEVTFVMGMFRSGTSITCQILKKIGLNFGPNWRLLKGKGKLKELNPDGFFEDFLFIQLPFYWCSLLDKNGENLPNEEDVKKFKLNPIKISDFISFSEFTLKDERISFFHRHFAYFLLIVKKEKVFAYSKNQIIKSPMLTPFYAQIKEWFPKGKFLIVIRNPESTIKSSLKLTKKADISLYNSYYIHLLNLFLTSKEKCVIFSYDNLLTYPEISVATISKYFGLPLNLEVCNLIKNDLIRNTPTNQIKSNYYEILYEKSINKVF